MKKWLDKIVVSRGKVFLILAIVGLAAYSVMLPGPFKTLDDYVSIIENQNIKSIAHLGEIFTTSFFGEGAYYRPLVHFSFMIEYHLFGLDAFYYNLDNVLIHILTAFGVFLIMAELIIDRRLAFLSALFFVIHPVHWECVSNVPGRSILLCSLFLVYGFLYFIYSRKDERKKLKWLFFSYFSFILSLLSKESGVVLPILLVSYVWFLTGKKLKDWGGIIGYFIVVALFLVWRRYLGILSHLSWESYEKFFLSVGSFIIATFDFAKRLIVPVNLYYDHSSPVIESLNDPRLLLSLFIWISILAAIFYFRKRLGRTSLFLLSWIVINFITVSQVVPVRASFDRISTADHFLYLPSIAVLTLLVVYFFRLYKYLIELKIVRRSILNLFIIGYGFFLFLTLIGQNIYATEQIAMFGDSLIYNPNNFRVRNSLAVAYALKHRLGEAQFHYKKSLELEPYNQRSLIGYGMTFSEQGKYWEAVKQYELITEPSKQYKTLYTGHFNFAYSMIAKKYLEMMKSDPNNPKIYYSLGIAYLKLKKYDGAIVQLNKSLKFEPGYRNSYFNLAAAYKLKNENLKALEYYHKALLIAKGNNAELVDDSFIYVNLGDVYYVLGDKKNSQDYYQRAVAAGIPAEQVNQQQLKMERQ